MPNSGLTWRWGEQQNWVIIPSGFTTTSNTFENTHINLISCVYRNIKIHTWCQTLVIHVYYTLHIYIYLKIHSTCCWPATTCAKWTSFEQVSFFISTQCLVTSWNSLHNSPRCQPETKLKLKTGREQSGLLKTREF